MTMNRGLASLIVTGVCSWALIVSAADPATRPGSADWPQFRGPNRDSVAVESPKLLDAWPKEGPPLVWTSEWIPGWWQGGSSGPVVADGKVFVYSTWHQPVGGGNLYKVFTPVVLAYWGWIPDLPDDLAKKIEAARTAKDKPKCQDWLWWASNATDRWAWMPGDFKDFKERLKEVDAYLAKKPELKKYIEDFIATLKPEEAQKYGDFIKNRLCITTESPWSHYNGLTWDQLVKLSKRENEGYATLRELVAQLQKEIDIGTFAFHYHELKQFVICAWMHSYTRSDVLVCLDAATGKTLWKKDLPLDLDAGALKKADASGGGTGVALGISGTPTVWGGKCYFAGLGGLYCLSAKDGALAWRVKCTPAHSSVLVAKGVVYYDGTAYEADTGRMLWKNPKDPGGATGSPALWVSEGKTRVLAPIGTGLICCLDLETGNALWTQKIFTGLVTTFTMDGDLLAVTGKTYKLTPAGAELVKTLADSPGAMFGSDLVIHQGYLYGGIEVGEGSRKGTTVEGRCCYDLKTGELKWSYKGPGFSNGFTPSILADGKIITAFWPGGGWNWNDLCSVAMFKATPEKHVLLGTFSPGLCSWTPMAFSDGRLFVRTETGISCYDLRAK